MSEHNHPHQQVGNQYNADAINIHHHHQETPVEPRSGDEAAARVREELEQLKSRFAKAPPTKLRKLLISGEDLLIHVCGQERYRSLMDEADVVEGHLQSAKDVGWFRDAVKHEWERKAAEAGRQLKRRIAGVEYRK